MSDTPLVVHHLDHSRSLRILWLLEELGLDYEVTEWKRDPKTMRAPAGLREIHPLGKAPVVQIGDTVLAESGAILEALLDRYGEGRLRPESGPALEQYRYWLHFAEGSFTPPLLVKLIMGQLKGDKVPFLARPLTRMIANQIDGTFTDAEIARNFAFVQDHLSKNDYFCGDTFTAADIQMSYPLAAATTRAGGSEFPAIAAHLDRIRARPAYQKAVERGGPLGAPG